MEPQQATTDFLKWLKQYYPFEFAFWETMDEKAQMLLQETFYNQNADPPVDFLTERD